jgi:hypothetical protein
MSFRHGFSYQSNFADLTHRAHPASIGDGKIQNMANVYNLREVVP